MKIRLNIYYLCAFIVVFIVETVIAVFVRDNFIRPYLGDVLVVVLIYCFIKAFVKIETKLLPAYIFIFAVLVEVGQYFSLAELLGLSDILRHQKIFNQSDIKIHISKFSMSDFQKILR